MVRYDQRGHGDSDVPSEPFGVDELGRDVLRLLDDLGVERASFCGVSMGGATGMWLAVNAPERIDRLVVACAAAKFGERESWFKRAAIVRADGVEAIADSILRRWFTPASAQTQWRASAQVSSAPPTRATPSAVRRSPAGTTASGSADRGADARDRRRPRHRHHARAGRSSRSGFQARSCSSSPTPHTANVQPDAFSDAVLAHLVLTEAA